MGKELLEKSRQIAGLMRHVQGGQVDFPGIVRVMAEMLNCNLYYIGRRGYAAGYMTKKDQGQACDVQMLRDYAERFPESINQVLLDVDETCANLRMQKPCPFDFEGISCDCHGKMFTLVPVGDGEWRMGTLVLCQHDGELNEEDILLTEYGALVIIAEVMRMRVEHMQDESGPAAAVRVAVNTLSPSEREALGYVLAEISGREGVVVASRVADRVGITRSVIASALRKLESAGIIESRSLGMKGTYINILNGHLIAELGK
ncbi:MAG: GTP-sensing pleiotropic transcriptional regulator CodY [Syntrophothermaceae bacterium]|jgi:transcriptional pleiotropic repressor